MSATAAIFFAGALVLFVSGATPLGAQNHSWPETQLEVFKDSIGKDTTAIDSQFDSKFKAVVTEKGVDSQWMSNPSQLDAVCGGLASKGIGDANFESAIGHTCTNYFSGMSKNAPLMSYCGISGAQCSSVSKCELNPGFLHVVGGTDCKEGACCCGSLEARCSTPCLSYYQDAKHGGKPSGCP